MGHDPFSGEKGHVPDFSISLGSSCDRVSFRSRGHMLMEIDRPPFPKRGLTTLLRVEPNEKLNPAENE